jgi:protease IV
MGYLVVGAMVWGLLWAVAYLNSLPLELQKGSVLAIDLDEVIVESPRELQQKIWGGGEGVTVRQIIKAIDFAAGTPEVEKILLSGSLGASDSLSWASLEELRGALDAFRAKGKKIIAYTSSLNERSLYLLSVADRLVVSPQAEVLWNGLGADIPFFKNALDKLGISVEVVRSGKYKSMGEFLTRTNASAEEREQMELVLQTIWNQICQETSAARNISEQQLRLIAEQEGLLTGTRAVELGLVDKVQPWHDFLLANDIAAEKDLVSFSDFLRNVAYAATKAKEKIALLYIDGTLMHDEHYIDTVKAIRQIADDKSIKALVVRINSGGGAVNPSAVIANELVRVREQKPVVVSMGGVAASGGYWISSVGSYIYTDNLTLTGSIGVVGIFPSVKKMADGLGITFDTLATGELATMGSLATPLTEKVRAVMSASVDATYNDFLAHVAHQRKLPMEEVSALAQGRVWTGLAAVESHLADGVGGILTAEAKARSLAGLDVARVESYPRIDRLASLKRLMGEPQPSLLGVRLGDMAKNIRASGQLWALSPFWAGYMY